MLCGAIGKPDWQSEEGLKGNTEDCNTTYEIAS